MINSWSISLFNIFLILCVELFYLLEKTIEGTAAGITSVLAACSVLLPHLASTGYFLTEVSLSLSLTHTRALALAHTTC